MSTIYGTNGEDILHGTLSIDAIYASDGNDSIYHDAQSAQYLQDYINGGSGIDTLFFSNGSWYDNILGNAAKIYNVEIIDVNGKSLFVEEGGTYNFSAITFQNTTGNIHVKGAIGAHITGSAQDNLIIGDITGISGDDTFYGGAGNDSLSGLEGNDTLSGGSGNDTFIFKSGADKVTDFEDNLDTLAFYANELGLSSVQDILNVDSEIGSKVIFDFGNGNQLEVVGAGSLANLADDIILL